MAIAELECEKECRAVLAWQSHSELGRVTIRFASRGKNQNKFKGLRQC